LFYLAWIASKVKAVTPALPAGNVVPSNPSVNDGVPNAAGGSVPIQSGGKQTTKRRRKKTTKAKIVSTTAAPPKKDGEGSDDDDDDDGAAAIVKRFIRALIK